MNSIFVFPGLGAQYAGMGKDIFNEFATARHAFQQVSDLSNKNIAEICFENPGDVLSTNDVSMSLATFTHSLAIGRVIESETGELLRSQSYVMAGHSAGQTAAFYFSGTLALKDAVTFCNKSFRKDSLKGGIACIMGLEKETLENIVADLSAKHGYAAISNYNSSTQFTVSGKLTALNHIIDAAQKANASIAMLLKIPIPSHCALMKHAEDEIRSMLLKTDVHAPKTKLFSDYTGDLIEDPVKIKNIMALKMTHGVKWAPIMEKFPQHQITQSFEVGPGKTLSGLIRRARVGCAIQETNNLAGLRKVIDALQKLK